jgi:outer membrane protein assembly factor BamB
MKSRLTLTLCMAMAAFTGLLFTSGQAGANFRAGVPSAGPKLQSPSLPIIPSGDWPMYGRDYSRTNYNPDETTLSSSNVAQWVSRWQVNIGSNGTPTSGAPSVSNGKVFVGSSVATGNNFFAFDAITGSGVWSTTVGYFNSGCFNVGIGSTSAISGTILSVGGGDGNGNSAFYGLDTTNGAQLWRHPMNVGSSGFAWESPLLANGRSYLGIASRCDNPSVRGEVRTVDAVSGAPQQNQFFVPSGTAGGGIWNSPALSPDGSTLVVVTGEDFSCSPNCANTRAMISLDPITLNILQVNQQGSAGVDQDFGTTPVIFSDNLGRTLVGANHKNGTFYAYVLNNINGGPLWSRATGTNVGMMPAYDPTFGSGGTLFISGGSSLFAVNPATNADRWSPVTVGTMHGNMAIANGLIYMNTGSTGLKIYNESTGALLRTIVPAGAGSANSGVVVSHGFVYWLSGSFINAWSLAGTPTPTNTPTNTPTITQTFTPTRTPTAVANTPTNTPINTPTDTPTSTSTYTPSITPTPTATPTGPAQPVLVGHVTWQSRPQPDPRSAIPITLTLRLQGGGPANEFTGMTTDANGVFTVTVVSLPNGDYYWRVKDPKYLATSGTVTLTGALVTNVEMGLQLAGDANDTNVVDASDFSILRGTFGKSQGQPGYDDRADFNGDLIVNSTDFSTLKGNFGSGGAPPIAPTGMH